MELPVLQFVPIAPCSVSGHHWKKSGPIQLTPSLYICISTDKIHPCCLLQAEHSRVSQPFLIGKCSRPLIISVAPHWILSRVFCELRSLNWTQFSLKVASPEHSRGGGSPPSTCWLHTLLSVPQDSNWPSWPQGHTASLLPTCCPTRAPKSFSTQLLSSSWWFLDFQAHLSF